MSAFDENKTLSGVSYETLPQTYTMMAEAITRIAGPPLAFKRLQSPQIYNNTPTGIPCTANPQISSLSRLIQQSTNPAATTDKDDSMRAPDPAHDSTHYPRATVAYPPFSLRPPTFAVQWFAAKKNPNTMKIPGHRPHPRYVPRNVDPIDYFDRADKVTMDLLKQKVQFNYKRHKIIEDGHNAMEYEIRQLERIEGQCDYTDWAINRHRKEQKNLKAGYPAEHGLEPKSKFMMPRYYRQLIKHCPWVAVAYQKERMASNRTQRVVIDPRLVRRQCNAKRRKFLAEDAIKRGEKPLSIYEDLVWPCEVEAFDRDEEDSSDEEEFTEETPQETNTHSAEAAQRPEQPQDNNPDIYDEAIDEEISALIDGLGIFPSEPTDPAPEKDESQADNKDDNGTEAEWLALEHTAGEKEAVRIVKELSRRVDHSGSRLDRTSQDVRSLFLEMEQVTRVDSAAAAVERASQAAAAAVSEQEARDRMRLNMSTMACNLMAMIDSDDDVLDPLVGYLREQDFIFESQPETHCSIMAWLSQVPTGDRLLDPEQAKPAPESEDE